MINVNPGTGFIVNKLNSEPGFHTVEICLSSADIKPEQCAKLLKEITDEFSDVAEKIEAPCDGDGDTYCTVIVINKLKYHEKYRQFGLTWASKRVKGFINKLKLPISMFITEVPQSLSRAQ